MNPFPYVGLDQDIAYDWIDMSNKADTINIHHTCVNLVQSRLIIISLTSNFFLPWYS